MAYLDVACRALLVGVFVFSVAGKVRGAVAYTGFVTSVAALWAGPRRWVRVVAVAAVAGEATVVVLLTVPVTVIGGFLLGAGLLAAFTAAILAAVRRGQRAPCRCFGASDTELGLAHVVRNAVLLAACALGLAGAAADTPAWHPGGVAVALAFAAVALLLVLRFDDLVAVVAPRSGDTARH